MSRRAANGEGTVRFNEKRNRFEGRVTVGVNASRQPVRRMVTGKSERDVRTKMRKLITSTEAGLKPAPRALTVAKFLDGWQADILPGTVALTTESQYRGIIARYLIPRLGRHRLANLTAQDVTRMLRALEAEGYSSTTMRLSRAVLRRALRYGEQEGYVARNVAAIADPPKSTADEVKMLAPAEARALLDAVVGHRLEAAVTVALTCGLRISELLGLSWDQVDLDAVPPRLSVRRGLKYVPGTGLFLSDVKTAKSRRTVALPLLAAAALKRQKAVRRDNATNWPLKPLGVDLVFRADNGEALDPANFRKALGKLSDDAGIGHVTPHQLRHSAASLMFAQGVPLKVVSETLGHSGIAITADIYVDLLDESRQEAASAIDRMLGGGA